MSEVKHYYFCSSRAFNPETCISRVLVRCLLDIIYFKTCKKRKVRFSGLGLMQILGSSWLCIIYVPTSPKCVAFNPETVDYFTGK